jgi:FixJ family two-component response regulator
VTVTKPSVVVLVDDDESIRKAITRSLRFHAISVEAFSSAEQYLYSECMPEAACLILDVMLPGMKGMDLQHRLIENGQHIPIIFITAHDDDHVREQALELGAMAFLRKPFQEQELMDAISSACEAGCARMFAREGKHSATEPGAVGVNGIEQP